MAAASQMLLGAPLQPTPRSTSVYIYVAGLTNGLAMEQAMYEVLCITMVYCQSAPPPLFSR